MSQLNPHTVPHARNTDSKIHQRRRTASAQYSCQLRNTCSSSSSANPTPLPAMSQRCVTLSFQIRHGVPRPHETHQLCPLPDDDDSSPRCSVDVMSFSPESPSCLEFVCELSGLTDVARAADTGPDVGTRKFLTAVEIEL